MLYSVYKQEGIYFSDFVYTHQTTLTHLKMLQMLCARRLLPSGCVTSGYHILCAEVYQ